MAHGRSLRPAPCHPITLLVCREGEIIRGGPFSSVSGVFAVTLVVILLLLFLVFGGSGLGYHSWGTGGPAWGGNVLYVLAFIVLVLLILNFVRPLGY
jgi:hypothetical protein